MCVARIGGRPRGQRRGVSDPRRPARDGQVSCSADCKVEVVLGGFAREELLTNFGYVVTRACGCVAKSSGNGAVRADCIGAAVGWSGFVSKTIGRAYSWWQRGWMFIG